ncbi:maleylpyruvate isomerase family mycothiol-dependent enzyme [Amycolatopsis sp. 195334CR]|uniref:maleylpyruvate isomerase family mycothiol-dependent enzyme n=1 Tax=Amycolatopsis sp. 195334CR TaxID=2814588 RepID=UPI001A8E6106|nr:maleylpyruvate isomerase family mycothiol-dependent enzyme [Amycolatopsis sp. 195334CR]MBN6033795.1 maleylpyruvate isomerase family mycothiol-dependent enzyme [Amycolatopsis sp. 195334CR]
MDPTWLTNALHHHTAAFTAAAEGGDPALVVPTCPEWRLRDLIGHIGQAHRWAAGMVRTGQPDAVPDPREADPPADWAGWLAEGATELADAVCTSDTVVPTLLGPGPAVFWLRRMLHDLVVHHADACLTTRRTTFEVAPDVATDAIDEALGLLSAPGAEALKPALTELRGTGQKLLLRNENTGWLITRTPDGIRYRHGVEAADVTVTGPVRDLLLLLTRRLPPARLAIEGDHALLDHWLTRSAL